MTDVECVIVGAGPIGCLMACYLADLGFRCKIWEKRPDPRKVYDSGGSFFAKHSHHREIYQLGSVVQRVDQSLPSQERRNTDANFYQRVSADALPLYTAVE